MEKRSEFRINRAEEINKEPEPEKVLEFAIPKPKKTTDSTLRRLRSTLAANLFVDGQSGRRYHFPMAGAEVNVAEEDFYFLLAKVIKNSSCCGQGGNERPLFEQV